MPPGTHGQGGCGKRKAKEAPRSLLAAGGVRASAPAHPVEDTALKVVALVRHGRHLCRVKSSRWTRAPDFKSTRDFGERGAPEKLLMMTTTIACIEG